MLYPNIYYLNKSMTTPLRCFEGLLLVQSLSDNVQVNIEGKRYNNREIYLINESELYEIHSDSVMLFYFPSSIFKNYDINIFDKTFYIDNREEIKRDLLLLFKYFKLDESYTPEAQKLLKNIVFSITKDQVLHPMPSTNILVNIRNYISRQLYKRITLESLSQEFYMSTSSISTLFKTQLNISFYEYITSLRIAKSMQDLVLSDKKIETIAHNWGYANATNYIIHFKKYIQMTPKKYKSLPVECKNLNIEGATNKFDVLKEISFNHSVSKQNIDITIKTQDISNPPFTYFTLIDIGNYGNLDTIINEPIFTYKNFNNFRMYSYIFISEPIDKAIQNNIDKTVLQLKKLLKTTSSIALKVTSIDDYKFILKVIEELHFLETEHLASSYVQNGNILLLIDLSKISLSDVQVIQRNVYGTDILIAVDITESFIQNRILNKDITNLDPDFYFIDFQKIKQISSNTNEGNAFERIHTTLRRYLNKIGAKNNIIFINYEKIYTPSLIQNISAFLDKTLKSKKYIAGASIRFTKKNKDTNQVAIFDEIENKTPFYFLGIMMLNFSRYACYYGKQYLLTKNPHSYNILIYNTDDTFTRHINEFTQTFHISYSDITPPSDVIVSCELLNYSYGSLDGIINHNVENRETFPDALKFKLNQYNSPLLKVDKHNFNLSPYVVEVPPKSIMLVTIYY